MTASRAMNADAEATGIPSEAQSGSCRKGSREVTFKLSPRHPSTALGMTAFYALRCCRNALGDSPAILRKARLKCLSD